MRLKRLKRKGVISMGQRPRLEPKKLPAKLFAIRQRSDLSQSQGRRIAKAERTTMPTKITNETDGTKALTQLLQARAVWRQRLHDATVQTTVIAAGLDKLVSCLIEVAEELKNLLDEIIETDELDE